MERFYRTDQLNFSYRVRVPGARNPRFGIPVLRGTITGTQASGCATTSTMNSYRHIKYHDVIHDYVDVHAYENVGSDDLLGVCDASDIPALEAVYARFYSDKPDSRTGLGLTIDGFKWSRTEADFLSMRVVAQGDRVVLSKFPRRFAAYGTSRLLTRVTEADYLREVASCVAAVLPNDPAYDFLRVAPPA